MVKRWARRLLLQIDGEVHRLTKEEIEVMSPRPQRKRRLRRSSVTAKAPSS